MGLEGDSSPPHDLGGDSMSSSGLGMGSPRGGGPRQPPAPADWVRRERQGKKETYDENDPYGYMERNIPPAPPMPPPEPPLRSSRAPSVVDDGASDHYRPPSRQPNQTHASSNGQDTEMRSQHDTVPMHSGQYNSMQELSRREFGRQASHRQASDWQEPARRSSHFDDEALPPPPSQNEDVLPLSIRHSGHYDAEFHTRGSEPHSARSSSNFDSLTPTPPPPPQAISAEYYGSRSSDMARGRYDDPSTTHHSSSSRRDASTTQLPPPQAPVEPSPSVPSEAPRQHASASFAQPTTKPAQREDTFDEELKLRVSLGPKAGKKMG
uniref:Epidermal growth factor receptor kinase substrate 8 n=1 Tax=Rhipicephalus zambeziensis TaxID=60191 RepID=A0A224YWV0_9ACAR